jgi:PKHD-type hydroxylase
MYSFWKWDKQIPKEYCDLMLKNIATKNFFDGSINNNIVDKKIRNTEIFWADPSSVVGCIAEKYIRMANIKAEWNYDLSIIENIQIGKYHSGGFYGWHQDNPITRENPRKLSFTMLLNDPQEFEGGKFEFKGVKEQPILEQGSIIVFPSVTEHRVTPVTKGVRYSAVTWMHGPNFR